MSEQDEAVVSNRETAAKVRSQIRERMSDLGGNAEATKGNAVNGVALIAAERQRQIDGEGWLPAHDISRHVDESLAWAAVSYAAPREVFERVPREEGPSWYRRVWPSGWRRSDGDRVRQLVKAGALIAAEIDRLTA